MEDKGSETLPLIKSSSSSSARGTASVAQTFGNIIVSIVGTGVLGLPFASRVAGWLAGSIGLLVAGFFTYYCMLLLVQCREKLASEKESAETATYGDLGYKSMGPAGGYLTESLIFLSQCGGSVAYLVFIGQNLESVFKGHGFSMGSFIFLLVPIEIPLSWIGPLSAFAPFSILADICNVLAMAMVLKEDIQQVVRRGFSFDGRKAITSNIGGIPFAGGMAVFCFEGFGMTLALEASMKKKGTFPKVLALAFSAIAFLYLMFGIFGYLAYGDETRDIITLNLPQNWTATAVQVGLCLGLVFTFPMMLRPMNEIVEGKLKRCAWFRKPYHNNDDGSITALGKLGIYISRAVLIMGLAILASFIPGFGVFSSLVGSTVCALISFVLPASFHLKLLGPSLNFWQKSLDILIVFFGLLFGAYSTYNTIVGVSV
ncbi:hypothetical protein SLE2022_139280 [Rubroshorea leprosula]